LLKPSPMPRRRYRRLHHPILPLQQAPQLTGHKSPNYPSIIRPITDATMMQPSKPCPFPTLPPYHKRIASACVLSS
jgi:hypothetical protein